MAKFRALAPIVGLAGLLALLPRLWPGAVSAWRYERARVAGGELWRLLTCHLVHADGRHLALNLAGLVLLAALYGRAARARAWGVVALVAALVIGLGLYAGAPSVEWYLGLSGVLHGLWAAGGVAVWRRDRREGAATLALLALKLAAEWWLGPVSSLLDGSLPVLTLAHRLGALGGLGAALALGLGRAGYTDRFASERYS